MSCSDIPSLLDLQNTKKHVDDFGRLMGTGEGDSTNEVTGQVRPTYNKVMKSVGFKPGSGDFTTGFTVMPGERDIAWYDPVSKNWYSYLGVIPVGGYDVLPVTNPVGDSDWSPRTDETLRGNLSNPNVGFGSHIVGFKQSFTGASDRTVHDKLSEIVSVDDFGPTGEVIGDSLAVSKAIAATPNGGAIRFSQNKTYILNGVSLSGKSITILAHGATIKGPAGVRVQGYFDLSGAEDIKIVGATVDLMHGSIPQYLPADYPNEYNRLFYGTGANSVTIESCDIKNLYNTIISSHQVNLTKVINNKFYSKAQDQNQVLDYIRCTTCAELVVEGNEFNSATPTSAAYGTCAVFASGISKSVTVRGNRFKNCGRDNTGAHRLGVVDFYFDVKNVNVSDNIADDCWSQFSRVSSCATGKIINNIINVNGAAELGYTLISVESIKIGAAGRACSDILIEGNTFNDPFNRHESHVGVYSYDWGLPSKDVRILNNKFVGAKNIVYIIGPYDGVAIKGNSSDGYIGKISVRSQGNQVLTSLDGTESNAAMSRLSICDNALVDTGSAGVQIDFDATKTPAYSGIVGDTRIADNTITNNASAGVYGVNLKGAPNLSGNIILTGNTIRGFSRSRRVQSVGALTDERNTTFNGSGLEVSSVTSVLNRFNSDYGSSVFGINKLVSGAVIVPSAEIKSTDKVLLVNSGTSGAAGTLYINSITPNSSFEIRSTSPTDASHVAWEIIHVA